MSEELKIFPAENIRLNYCAVIFEDNHYKIEMVFDDVVYTNFSGEEAETDLSFYFDFDAGFKEDEKIINPASLIANDWKLLGRKPELVKEEAPFIHTGYIYPVLLHRLTIGEVKDNKIFLDFELLFNFEKGYAWFKDVYFPVKGWFEFKNMDTEIISQKINDISNLVEKRNAMEKKLKSDQQKPKGFFGRLFGGK